LSADGPQGGHPLPHYRLCTLDVTPDNEINDAYATDTLLNLPDEPTVDEVCRCLKTVGRMAPDWPTNKVQLVEDGDDYLVCDARGHKSYLLRRAPDHEPL